MWCIADVEFAKTAGSDSFLDLVAIILFVRLFVYLFVVL